MKRTRAVRSPAACTIVSRNYLSHARVLAESYLKHHPAGRFYLLVIDGLPEGAGADGMRVISAQDLNLSYFHDLCFKYDVTELCTAVKPTLLKLILQHYGEEQVMYLDPDILVMRPLLEAFDGLSAASIILTPHLLKPIPQDGLRPAEQDILVAGTYNLGFIGVRSGDTASDFLNWWEQRLRDGCFVDVPQGLMTDQKWIDLVPGLFPTTILKDDTYNVAYWNIHSRRLEHQNGQFLVNGRPLAFFHFSGFDPARPSVFSKHQDRTTIIKGTALSELLDHYVTLQMLHGFSTSRTWSYGYGKFDNDVRISLPMRRVYRHLSADMRLAFPDPFRSGGTDSFQRWATLAGPVHDPFSPFLKSVYALRPDVAELYPDIHGKDRDGFMQWVRTSGVVEFGYDAEAMGLQSSAQTHPKAVERKSTTGAKCSILIPVYNKASLTMTCLDAVLSTLPADFACEIVVADDASSDNTADVLKSYGDQIRVVSHKTNEGFSISCNDAAAIAAGEYLIFLNNDTLPQPGWLEALVTYAEQHANARVIGSKLLFPNETIQHAGIVFSPDGSPRHVYCGFPAIHPLVNRSRQLQAVTGACLLIRRDDFGRAKGFDPTFHNGYEDIDLCLRVGEWGGEVHYCHQSVLYHLEAVSRDQSKNHEEIRNATAFQTRWANRVRSDELSRYLEDGLLRIEHHAQYPLALSVSPLLAVVNVEDRERHADRLLETRSHQVIGLLKDNIRLSVRVQEAELRSKMLNSSAAPQPQPHKGVVFEEPRVIWRGRMRWMSSETTKRLISIILPVKNGGHKLRDLLPAILRQETCDQIEIIAIDSDSQDDSVELLKQADATVVSIDPRSFNHGLTRNLAAQYAQGGILVFLNQSTLPGNTAWLSNLVSPFARDPDVAAVFGRVLPRPDADLLTARETIRNVNAASERATSQISDWNAYRSLPPEMLRAFVNFHTLSAAIRADVFQRMPFRDANFGEDLLWGKEALESGLRIQFEPSSVALHSHNYSLLDILRRNFDDGVACRAIVGRTIEQEALTGAIINDVRNTWRYLEQECALQGADLDLWRITAAARRTLQVIGQWLGSSSSGVDERLAVLLSITEQIKAGAQTEVSQGRSAANANSAG